MPRHSASARYTSPNRRERSMRMPFQANRYRQMFAAIIEELRALRRADQMLRQCPGLDAAACIGLSEVWHPLLNDASSNSDAAPQPPIAVNLAVLSKRRVAQIHSRESKYHPPIRENTLG